MIYSHFERSAVCSSPGLYVGRKDSEVQVANADGRLMQAGTSLTFSHTDGYYGNSPTVAAGTYRIAAGSAACSRSCTIDTGLTTVLHAVCNVMGRHQSGKVCTLDLIASPDLKLYRASHAQAVQWRISGNDLKVKVYGWHHQSRTATMDPLAKRQRVSWIAFGT